MITWQRYLLIRISTWIRYLRGTVVSLFSGVKYLFDETRGGIVQGQVGNICNRIYRGHIGYRARGHYWIRVCCQGGKGVGSSEVILSMTRDEQRNVVSRCFVNLGN